MRFRPDATDKTRVRVLRMTSALVGSLRLGIALLLATLNLKSLMVTWTIISALLGGGIVGVYSLGHVYAAGERFRRGVRGDHQRDHHGAGAIQDAAALADAHPHRDLFMHGVRLLCQSLRRAGERPDGINHLYTQDAGYGGKLKRALTIPALLLLPMALLAAPAPMEVIDVPIAAGPCQPTWKSLGDNFKAPPWWRQAKIGVWLHWGPQSVGEDGDWYAKWIYMPKYAWGRYTGVYKDHLDEIRAPQPVRLQRHSAPLDRG